MAKRHVTKCDDNSIKIRDTCTQYKQEQPGFVPLKY